MRLLGILFPCIVSVGKRGPRRVLLTAVPPSAAERLEKRRGVRVARRLRLNQTDLRLLVLALRVEKREIARRADWSCLVVMSRLSRAAASASACALSATASNSRANSTSATFWNAPRTVC